MGLATRKVLRAGDLAFTTDASGNVTFDANVTIPGILTNTLGINANGGLSVGGLSVIDTSWNLNNINNLNMKATATANLPSLLSGQNNEIWGRTNTLYINWRNSANDLTSAFTTTILGNGKGASILTLTGGATNDAAITGTMSVSGLLTATGGLKAGTITVIDTSGNLTSPKLTISANLGDLDSPWTVSNPVGGVNIVNTVNSPNAAALMSFATGGQAAAWWGAVQGAWVLAGYNSTGAALFGHDGTNFRIPTGALQMGTTTIADSSAKLYQAGKQVIDTIGPGTGTTVSRGTGATAGTAYVNVALNRTQYTTGTLVQNLVSPVNLNLQASMALALITKVEILNSAGNLAAGASNLEFKVFSDVGMTNLLYHAGNPTKLNSGDVDGIPWEAVVGVDGFFIQVISATGSPKIRFTSVQLA